MKIKSGNKAKHILFGRYRQIKYHCENPNSPRWKFYGGRGIELTKSWSNDFWSFAEWIENNIGLPMSCQDQLDRIDHNGNYEPGNLRWATAQENHRNRINNTVITINGRTQVLTEWCEELKLWNTTVLRRIHVMGLDPVHALGIEPHPRVRA